jgi:hypothetical protein
MQKEFKANSRSLGRPRIFRRIPSREFGSLRGLSRDDASVGTRAPVRALGISNSGRDDKLRSGILTNVLNGAF